MKSRARRILVLLSVLLVAAATVFVVGCQSPPVNLFHYSLSKQDTLEVSSYLTQVGIEHEIVEEQILISPDLVESTLKLLAEINLPRRHPAPAPPIVDRTSKHMEIVAKLVELEKVGDARVLVMSKSKYFEKEGDVTKARVLLQVAPQQELTGEDIEKVKSLVADSVPDLVAENVRVCGPDGQALPPR